MTNTERSGLVHPPSRCPDPFCPCTIPQSEPGFNRFALRMALAFLALGLLSAILASAPFRPQSLREALFQHVPLFLPATVAVYFASHHFMERLKVAWWETDRAKLEVVHRLALIAEWKDDTLGGHNYRVARYAAIVAEELGLGRQFAHTLFHATMLHDIGKVGVPDEVLKKRGPITAEEMAVLRRHVETGARLLDGSRDEVLRRAKTVALTHHERWNGSGYPRGLAGEAIPMEGRIVAVCDVLDALVSERHYKEAWSMKSALEYLTERRGIDFDARVVNALLHCVPEIERVRDEVPVVQWLPHPPAAPEINWERLPIE